MTRTHFNWLWCKNCRVWTTQKVEVKGSKITTTCLDCRKQVIGSTKDQS